MDSHSRGRPRVPALSEAGRGTRPGCGWGVVGGKSRELRGYSVIGLRGPAPPLLSRAGQLVFLAPDGIASFAGWGWIPMKTERWDHKAFGSAVELLKAGKAVVIFPEGTRTPDGMLQPGKPGIGRLVDQAQCPVVPVYLKGTYQVLPMGASWVRRHPVEVSFGEVHGFSRGLSTISGKRIVSADQSDSNGSDCRIARRGSFGNTDNMNPRD